MSNDNVFVGDFLKFDRKNFICINGSFFLRKGVSKD